MLDQFVFLKAEWPEVHQAAAQAAAAAHSDPRTACFHARRALELAVHWAFRFDASLRMPYDNSLSALIHDPGFRAQAGHGIFQKARLIKDWGNNAVHNRPVKPYDALSAVRELFHVGYWFARTYARGARPTPALSFDVNALPKTSPLPAQTVEQLQKLESENRAKDEKLRTSEAANAALDEENKRLRAELAEAKKARATEPDSHDYSEAETRDHYIDLLLKEAGWALEQPRDREFEVTGMPNAEKKGFVDYVLWGDDGKPLALVEAKRTKKSAELGQQQAKLYADCLEQRYGQRPVIFYSNGYEHWLWDDVSYPPRPVQGFYKKSELSLLMQRRTIKKSLAAATINADIVDRYYQTRAIRRIGEAFERDKDRKALVVMATGSGKTRTVIALCDLLMRCNWVKRVLFLADRVALVNQAAQAFKKELPDAAPVNLVTDKETEGRIYMSTYPTMMGLIDATEDGARRFGTGHFDLIVIDEAHRSVYQKYGAIFGYFDALLVGLTATPKQEVHSNTYRLFELETGVPTDAYDLTDAIKDGFLVPPIAVSVPLKFQREGITYDDLTEDEQEQWDEAEWDEGGATPARVEAPAVNKWLFNTDTVDKVLEHLMTRGQKVAGGDRLGKSIVFAKNQTHAEFIAERFNANYPHYKGTFARVVHCDLPYVQSVIDSFSDAAKEPHIAISVDMLDTGIDVPEVVNLVFFKLVRSKTKFWQMLGRGTRLKPELFGPGKNKEFFYIFDYCQNLEFFRENPQVSEGSLSDSLGKRLFKTRLELVGELDANTLRVADGGALRSALVGLLHAEVAAMNLNNFVVRPKRRLVEQYAERAAWEKLDAAARGALATEVAGLPSELEAEDQEAKRFDLLLLRLQIGLIQADAEFARLRDQVKGIACVLEEKASIPVVKEHLELILQVQSDEWWEGVTLPMLESVRKKLRSLVKLIDKQKRKPIYTDFEDQLGTEGTIELPGFTVPDQFERFLAKARAFLKEHQDHVAIHKLRMNKPLTPSDLTELERMLIASGVGDEAVVHKAKAESAGLGLFVRSLIGLDREAAKKAFGAFLDATTFSASQIEFVNLIVNQLTEQGVMSAKLLYESPFTDIAPTGPDGLFGPTLIEQLMAAIDGVQAAALGQ
jgi:type I restriction enzyme R subunit